MTSPAQQQPDQQQLTAQLAPVLATGGSVTALTPTLTSLLVAAGVSAAAASAATTLIGASSAPAVLPTGVASRATATSENIYRAAYLAAAAQRIDARIRQGMTRRDAVLAERAAFKAHLRARANRRRAAQVVDRTAASHGTLLGWQARMDDRTSGECRGANGSNFSVFDRPVIGWPGTVHPYCRCRPVAPFVGAGMVGQVTQEQRRAVA